MKYLSNIISGKGRGRKLGFPTLNLVIPQNFDADHGVYAARVWIEKTEFLGALHYGSIPTFEDDAPSLEIFLLDYDGLKVLTELEFELIKKIREIKSFASVAKLKKQISEDVKEILRSYSS